MKRHTAMESIDGVCDVERHGSAGPQRSLLIELPHGATRAGDYERLAGRLASKLPDRLCEFFFVNTDVGCYETAQAMARLIGGRNLGYEVVVVRCLLPRTLVDCNRVLGADGTTVGGMTPAIPDYVDRPEDREWLARLHASYQQLVDRAYDTICGGGGLALQLHTYAPRSIRLERIDGSIVEALHRAYEPAQYETWDRRPVVELISEDLEGKRLAPPRLVEEITSHYAGVGIEVAQNETYRLHHDTTGYLHAIAFPERVCCVELNRERLADPFTPFAEMRISPVAAQRMAEPLVSAYIDHLEQGA